MRLPQSVCFSLQACKCPSKSSEGAGNLTQVSKSQLILLGQNWHLPLSPSKVMGLEVLALCKGNVPFCSEDKTAPVGTALHPNREAWGRKDAHKLFLLTILKRNKSNGPIGKYRYRIRKYMNSGKFSASILQEALLCHLALVRCHREGNLCGLAFLLPVGHIGLLSYGEAQS